MTILDSQLKRKLHNTNIAYIAAATSRATTTTTTCTTTTATAFVFTHFINFFCDKVFNSFNYLLANNFRRKQIATNKRWLQSKMHK